MWRLCLYVFYFSDGDAPVTTALVSPHAAETVGYAVVLYQADANVNQNFSVAAHEETYLHLVHNP